MKPGLRLGLRVLGITLILIGSLGFIARLF